MEFNVHNCNLETIFSLIKNERPGDRELLEKAYIFAEKAHREQKRNNGDPYFTHVFATAKNLAELGMNATVIAAGFLHDTVEDTAVTGDDIKREFGEEILKLVQGVTKLGAVKYKGVERNVENLRKFFVSMAEDLRVIIIKLADRLHNVETLAHVREDKRERIAKETLEIYAPLANRLSMGKLKGRLEDAAFPYAYPKEYAQVLELLKERVNEDEKHLLEFEQTLLDKLKETTAEIISVDHRTKHLYSLFRKLQKYDMDITKVYDIIALRVVVASIADCYHVFGIIHGNWKPLPGRIKDYIALPKPNGYRSLHTTVFTGTGGIVEIQIRTEEMHLEAEYGVAAHFAYKEKMKTSTHGIDSQYEWIEELRDTQKSITDSDSFFASLSMDFFHDRVFAFTPKGDVINLPADASVVDFAYNVHSDIGNHANGAKVNGKFVGLDTRLRNGDIVEVITQKNTKPNPKWLEFVKTGIARNRINKYMRENSLTEKFKNFLK